MHKFQQARGSVQATMFAFPDSTQMLHRECALRQLLSFIASKRAHSGVIVSALGRPQQQRCRESRMLR